MLGKSLESGLGTFKMNVYFIGGWLLNTLGGLIIYLIFHSSPLMNHQANLEFSPIV